MGVVNVVTSKLVTMECHGKRADPHEPTAMESEYNDSAMQHESECPTCGTVVVS